MKASTIASHILEGQHDDDLDVIRDAIRSRAEIIRTQDAAKLRAQLRKGTKVRTTGNLSPKYLLGLTGKVKAVNGEKADVTFDEPFMLRRYQHSHEHYGHLGIPLTCLEKV